MKTYETPSSNYSNLIRDNAFYQINKSNENLKLRDKEFDRSSKVTIYEK